MSKYMYEAIRYAIVLCRNKESKFLCTKQNQNKGWWLTGGKVEVGETFLSTALREC